MNWTDVVSGMVGGFAGSAVPGWLAWLGPRRERTRQLEDRWSGKDAPVVADAIRLLQDVDPARRMASISSVPAAEQATWDDIEQRRARVSALSGNEIDRHVWLRIAPVSRQLRIVAIISTASQMTSRHALLAGRGNYQGT